MWSIHPDAFQHALTPVPGNGVVRVGSVPVDLCATGESYKKHPPSGEEVLPTTVRYTKKSSGQLLTHNLVGVFHKNGIWCVFPDRNRAHLFRTNQQCDESEGSLDLAIIGKHVPIIGKNLSFRPVIWY